MLRQMTEKEREVYFGKLPKIVGIAPGGRYIQTSEWVEWEKKNIITFNLPAPIPTYGGIAKKVRCHIKVLDDLSQAFLVIHEKGLWQDLLFYGGGYEPRPIRGGNIPSSHCFGAIDLNPQQNPLNGKAALPGEIGSLHRVAPIFAEHGFYQLPHDMMHFEKGILFALDFADPNNPIYGGHLT